MWWSAVTIHANTGPVKIHPRLSYAHVILATKEWTVILVSVFPMHRYYKRFYAYHNTVLHKDWVFYFIYSTLYYKTPKHRDSSIIFSSPELKAQVSFSDHLSSVVCLSICLSVCLSVCLSTFHIFIFFSRTTGPISTKLGTKHPWVKGIQVCSNEGPRPFPRGDDYEIVKIHWRN